MQTQKPLCGTDKASRPHLLAPTLLAFLFAATVAGLIIAFVEHLHVEEKKVTAANTGQAYVRIVSQSVSQALSATYALAALVRQGGGTMRDFEGTARQMLQLYPGVGALELAPGGTVRDIVPMAGNEGAVGHRLLQDPERNKEAFLARDTGKLTLAGPFDLVQGGVAAAGRLPVFLPDPAGGQKFWGFTIALLRFPDLLEAAGLSKLIADGYHYELWRIHPDTGKRQVFGASGSTPLVDPVNHSFEVPNGVWTLSVAPIAGWSQPATLWPQMVVGLLGSLLFALLVRYLIRQPAVLREEVVLRTAELAASNNQLETLLNSSPIAVAVARLSDGALLKVNSTFTRLFRYPDEGLMGRKVTDLDIFTVEERAQLAASVRELGAASNIELILHRKDGTPVHTYTSSVPFSFAGQECLLHMIVDVSDKKGVEQELALREQQLRVIFDTSQAGIILIDPQGVITFANECMAVMFGCTLKELIGSRYPDHLHPDERPAGEERMRKLITGEVGQVSTERHYVRADGSDFWGYLSKRRHEAPDGSLISLVGIIADITEKKRLEEESIRGQKLESLGILAGGIAHDFNNILAAILGNVSLARALVEADHSAAPHLEQCEKAAGRAGELTRQLLSFARGGEPVRKTVNARLLLEESLSFALRGANVKGVLECRPDLWCFDADAGQISQVLNNLLINAKQAMPQGGTVTVRAENVVVNPGDPYPVQPGRYVRVAVADQGTGIAPGDLQKIFDPYFTTKSTGTGLGLTSVYSIIRRHGGTITVSSEPNRGSTFTLLIPAATEQTAQGEKEQETIRPSSSAEHVLVMDDEEMMRELVVAMLEQLGYTASSCSDGKEAVDLHAASLEHGRPFAAIILDLTVPGGIGGKEAAVLIRKTDPKVPLIVSSGYSDDAVVTAYREHGFSGAVAKPYTLRVLASELARVIRERDRG